MNNPISIYIVSFLFFFIFKVLKNYLKGFFWRINYRKIMELNKIKINIRVFSNIAKFHYISLIEQ